MTNPPKAYSYIRMSTDLQLKGDSLRRQLETSNTYAAANGLELVPDDRLQDIGISAFKGANVEGGALGRFLDVAKAGKVPRGSYLLVESLDRLSRQEIRKSLTLFLNIINAGINIVTLADGRLYTEDKCELEDLLTSLVVMSRAHEESLTKSRRISAAWANKRKKAETHPLTAICPAWLKLSKDRKKYEIIRSRAATIKRIFSESASGIGNYSITQRLNKQRVPHFGRSNGWHISYVSKILKNRAVIGEYQPHRLIQGKRVPDGDPIPNYFPAAVDVETFYRVKNAQAERRHVSAGRKGIFLSNMFSGIAKCAYCRSPMNFENKGKPPKGGTFLVCSNGKRGLGCEIARWRYDAFEASFLAFVRELDLAQVIGTEDSSKRAELENSIAALSGELTETQTLRDKTFELFAVAGAAQGYVAGKLNEVENRISEIERLLAQKRSEQLTAEADAKLAQQNQQDVKQMLAALKKAEGDDLYKLRAQIADRIRTLTTVVLVAPAGDVPRLKKTIETLEREAAKDFHDVIEKLKADAEGPKSQRRYFAVGFRNGTTRIVRPSDDDPLEFEEQLYADKGGISLINPS